MRRSFEWPPFDNEDNSDGYEFFAYPEERRELFDYSQKIAEYLRSEKVPNLIIVDRSSRPFYIGISEYLKSRYPEEKMPNIFFMNPKGFKAKEEMSPREIREIIKDCRAKEDLGESPDHVRNKKEITDEFNDVYKRLITDKEKPVLVFDTCIHSGNSLEPIKKMLERFNFSDIRIGTINESEPESKIKEDFYTASSRPEKGCYPFDRDKIIEKTFEHVYSKRTDNLDKRDRSIRLRKEIKRIMTDFLEKDNE